MPVPRCKFLLRVIQHGLPLSNGNSRHHSDEPEWLFVTWEYRPNVGFVFLPKRVSLCVWCPSRDLLAVMAGSVILCHAHRPTAGRIFNFPTRTRFLAAVPVSAMNKMQIKSCWMSLRSSVVHGHTVYLFVEVLFLMRSKCPYTFYTRSGTRRSQRSVDNFRINWTVPNRCCSVGKVWSKPGQIVKNVRLDQFELFEKFFPQKNDSSVHTHSLYFQQPKCGQNARIYYSIIPCSVYTHTWIENTHDHWDTYF